MLYFVNPKEGTALFAVLFFFARLGSDWLFRWYIPGEAVPPLWAIIATLGFGTVLASIPVYLLLKAVQREHSALSELNHELRNTLQILTYSLPNCDAESQQHLSVVVDRMETMLRRVSRVAIEARQRRHRIRTRA